MEELCANLVTRPTNALHARIAAFVTLHAPIKQIPMEKAFYILHNGHQFFDRNALERLHAWDEVEVILSIDDISKFEDILSSLDTFSADNAKVEHAIRSVLRICQTEEMIRNVLPNCVHQHLGKRFNTSTLEMEENSNTSLIKQRVVQLMILFPNL
jgi:hypothetical protein